MPTTKRQLEQIKASNKRRAKEAKEYAEKRVVELREKNVARYRELYEGFYDYGGPQLIESFSGRPFDYERVELDVEALKQTINSLAELLHDIKQRDEEGNDFCVEQSENFW